MIAVLTRAFLCACALYLSGVTGAAAAPESKNWVDEFTSRVLKKDRIPNVRQYYQYCQKAEGDELNEELRMGTEICLRNNWVPVHEHPDCMRYMSRRRPHPESHRFPSLFLSWLRTQLPLESGGAQILRTQTLTDNDVKYELIQTRLAGKNVVFRRPLSDDKKIGKICVISIDGAQVSAMLDEYLLASQQNAPRGDGSPSGDAPSDASRTPAPPSSDPADLQEPLIDD